MDIKNVDIGIKKNLLYLYLILLNKQIVYTQKKTPLFGI